MYGREASVLYRSIRSEGWPYSHYQEQDIIPLERALLYEYVKTSLYEKQLTMGMLSPYAQTFYPVTNNLSSEKDTTEIGNDKLNTKEKRKQDEQTVKKDIEKSHSNESKGTATKKNDTAEKPRETQTPIIEELTIDTDDHTERKITTPKDQHQWKTVKKQKKNQHITNHSKDKHNNITEYIKVSKNTNSFAALKHQQEYEDVDIEEEEENNEERRKVIGSESRIKRDSYDVEELALNELNLCIREVISKDNEEDNTTSKSSEESTTENTSKVQALDAFTIESTDEESSNGESVESEENDDEENLHGNDERNHKMEQLLYQNDLLLFRLEQAELNEEKLREEIYFQTKAKNNDTNQEVMKVQKQLKDKEEEWRIKVNEYERKIETVEKALAVKTKQLIDQVRRRK